MSGTVARAFVAVVFVLSLPVACWQIRHAWRHELERDRIIREAHEQAEIAREVDRLEVLYSLPAFDPAWDAGCERLWDAIRDEQQKKGDQT